MAKARKTERPAGRRRSTKGRAAPVKKRAAAKPAAKKRSAKVATSKPAGTPAMKRAAKPPKNASVPPSTNMVVVTSGERPLREVADDLRRAGFHVEQTLDAIGQVTGRATPALKSRLAKVRGVTDVSAEHPPFTIAPPDAPVQ